MQDFFGFGALIATALGIVLATDAATTPASNYPKSVSPPSLSQVLAAAEKHGLNSILEASLDDSVWEVEGFREDKVVELHLDPRTLELLGEHSDSPRQKLPLDTLSARIVAESLEKAGYSPVTEIEWDRNVWEAEALHNHNPRQLRIHPTTAKILSDRFDD